MKHNRAKKWNDTLFNTVIIVAAAIIGLIGSMWISQDRRIYEYSVTSMIYVTRVHDARTETVEESLSMYQELLMDKELATDFTAYITSEAAYNKIRKMIGIEMPWLNTHEYNIDRHFIQVNLETQSRLVAIEVATDNPYDAAAIANLCPTIIKQLCMELYGFDVVQVVNVAEPSDAKISPKRGAVLAIGLGGGLFIGILIVVQRRRKEALVYGGNTPGSPAAPMGGGAGGASGGTGAPGAAAGSASGTPSGGASGSIGSAVALKNIGQGSGLPSVGDIAGSAAGIVVPARAAGPEDGVVENSTNSVDVSAAIDVAADIVTKPAPARAAQGALPEGQEAPAASAQARPRVLYLNSALEMGGTEKLLVDLFDYHTQTKGKDLSLSYLIMNEKTDAFLRARLLSTGAEGWFWDRREGDRRLRWFFQLRRLIKSGGFDVLHTHTTGGRYWGALMKTFCPGLRLVHTIHNVREVPGYRGRSLNIVRRRVDRLIAISEAVKAQCIERKLNHVSLIYNGFFTERTLERGRSDDWLATWTPLRFVSVARLTPETKGQDLILEALSVFAKKGYQFTITFIGDITGPYQAAHKQLLEKAESLGLPEEFVVFKGQVDNVAEHLADFDVFISASRYEAFGISLLEAMAAGLLVVSSSAAGPSEILEQGKYGYLFEVGSAHALMTSIYNVFKLSAEERQRMAVAGRQRAGAFDISRTYDGYRALYAELA